MFYLDVASWVELFNQLFYHPYGHKSDDQAEIIEYCYFSLSLILTEYFFLEILTVKSLDNKKKKHKMKQKSMHNVLCRPIAVISYVPLGILGYFHLI